MVQDARETYTDFVIRLCRQTPEENEVKIWDHHHHQPQHLRDDTRLRKLFVVGRKLHRMTKMRPLKTS
jgi:hypothetical protein